MVGIKTIPISATTETRDAHFLFTMVRVRRNPWTPALIADVEAFRVKNDAARGEEGGLIEGDAEAGASAQFADQDVDASVDFVADNTDMKSLLGVRLFGEMRRSELKKYLLGAELEIVSTWPDVLAQSEKSVLVAHVPLLLTRLATAHAAAAEKKGSSNKLADFRAVGTRVKINEEHNAFRKALYGKLGEIQHANGLPSGWAESFFMQDSSESLSLTDYDRKISAMEADLESLKKQRDALKAHGAKVAAVRAEAVRKEKQAKLEAFAKAKAELEAKENALRAELEEDEGAKEP